MRTIGSPFKTAMGLDTTTMARLLRITRGDGTVLRLSSTGQDEVFGAATYLGDPGFVSTSVTVESGATPYIDVDFGAEIGGADVVTAEDVDRGLYSHAKIELYRINYLDLTQSFLEAQGYVANVEFTDTGLIRFDTRGGTEDLAQINEEKFQASCAVNVGTPRCGVPILPDDVDRSTAYAIGDYVRVDQSGYQNRMFRCTTAGTTAGSAPSYNYTVAATTTDGTAVFTAEEAWMRQGTIATVDDRYAFTVTLTESRAVNDWFSNGQIKFTSGANDGLWYDVRKWVQSGAHLYIWTRARFDVVIGDAFEIYPGCGKTIAICNSKFANQVNFQGFPYLPGKDVSFTYVPVVDGGGGGGGGDDWGGFHKRIDR